MGKNNNKDESLNIFIEPIIEKRKKFDLPSYIKMKKLTRKLRKTSPDYNMLFEIYEFLTLLEKLYMYTNSDDHYLFSGTVPNSFIYKEGQFNIKFVLKPDEMIYIEVERIMRSKKEKNNISFRNGEYICADKYEEEMFLFIIACIMNGLVELIEYYYKHKRL